MDNSITVTVKYDEKLEKLTGCKEHPCFLSNGSTLLYLLQNVDMSYPEIFQTYKPGELGILLNHKPIQKALVLMDGDVVEFLVG